MPSSRALFAAAATASQVHLIQKQQAAPFLFHSTLNLLRVPVALPNNASYPWTSSAVSFAALTTHMGSSSVLGARSLQSLGAPSTFGNSSDDGGDMNTCAEQPLPATWETVVGACVALGMFISYLPQIIKIFSRRSSEGLSAFYLLMGEISCFSIFSNSMILQYEQIECCAANGSYWCAASLLSSLQLGVQFFMFSIMYISFFIFFPSNLKHHNNPEIYPQSSLSSPCDSSDGESETSLDNPTSHLLGRRRTIGKKPINRCTRLSAEWKSAIGTAVGLVIYTILCIVIMVGISIARGPKTIEMKTFAAGLGLISMVVSVFMYLPQIVRTWRSQETGALSILMMCIQTPGTVVLTLFLATRPGASWSTWLTYVATGTLQAILLGMCIYLNIKNKKKLKASRPMFFDDEDDYERNLMDGAHRNQHQTSDAAAGGKSRFLGAQRSINAVAPGDVLK